jgi:hypothetical protein
MCLKLQNTWAHANNQSFLLSLDNSRKMGQVIDYIRKYSSLSDGSFSRADQRLVERMLYWLSGQL